MEPETRRFWLIALALVVGVLALMLFGRAREEVLPTPERAWVAIEVPGSGIARAGKVEVEAGGGFTLHAVLEAKNWQGETVYYTEASRLELPEGEVDPERLRPWSSSLETKVLWFSVEAAKPFLEVENSSQLDELQFREYFLAEWPRTWSVSGKWGGPSAGVVRPRGLESVPFGTRRFHVRIQLFGPESEIRPRSSFQSWGGAELRAEVDRFPTVLSRLSGTLGPASVTFGLPQLETVKGADPELVRVAADWRSRRLAFSRLAVIKGAIDAAGAAIDELVWRTIELTGETEWEAPGVLLRVGDRWVLTYQDLGIEGRLDYEDLCFDFDKGAAIRRLGDIFVGEGSVERARL